MAMSIQPRSIPPFLAQLTAHLTFQLAHLNPHRHPMVAEAQQMQIQSCVELYYQIWATLDDHRQVLCEVPAATFRQFMEEFLVLSARRVERDGVRLEEREGEVEAREQGLNEREGVIAVREAEMAR